MPCNCDYMEPSESEFQSQLTCQHIQYVLKTLDRPVPQWIKDAAKNSYGNPSRLNEAVVTLCDLCHELTTEQEGAIIYDGRNPRARALADWWDRHKAADKARKKKEREEKNKLKAIASAKDKLTADEKKALGIA